MVSVDESNTSLLGLNNNYENKEASKKLDLTNKASIEEDSKPHKNPKKELFPPIKEDNTENDNTQTKEASKSSEIDDLIKKYCPKLSEKTQSSNDKAAAEVTANVTESPKADVIKIAPIPGICVKSKKANGEKVFINICKHTEIPAPIEAMTEERLKTIIDKPDASSLFRVPMHFGVIRTEQDKSGGKCLAFDVIINYKWSDEVMSKSSTFTTFVVYIAMEGLVDQEGNKIQLDRDGWNILKNKKYLETFNNKMYA